MQTQKQSRKKPALYAAPEIFAVELTAESVICLSDGVTVDDLVEVEEKW